MNDCSGLCGKLFGHKFKARMDTEEIGGKWPFTEGTLESRLAGTNTGDAERMLINATKSHKTTYVHDICVRCGKVIKRNP